MCSNCCRLALVQARRKDECPTCCRMIFWLESLLLEKCLQRPNITMLRLTFDDK